jgi:hypothetical protein
VIWLLAHPAAAVLARCKRDVEVMGDMNRTFELMDSWSFNTQKGASRGMDYIDVSGKLRIVTSVIASDSWVVGASFQDYACNNYSESKLLFDPLVKSLRFNE